MAQIIDDYWLLLPERDIVSIFSELQWFDKNNN